MDLSDYVLIDVIEGKVSLAAHAYLVDRGALTPEEYALLGGDTKQQSAQRAVIDLAYKRGHDLEIVVSIPPPKADGQASA
jgi:hypothetical protein